MTRFLFSALLFSIFCGSAIAQTEESMQLENADLVLDGTLTLPPAGTGPVPVVLLIAGSGPTDRNGNNPIPAGQPNSVKANSYKMLADSLAALGIATLRYDKRGVGRSIKIGLTERGLTFETFISDATAWGNKLKADKRFSKLILAGHSEGSLIGMIAARKTHADAYISLAGPGDDITSKLKNAVQRKNGGLNRQNSGAET